MTEMGWDRLARHEAGFHGSLLTWEREFAYATQHWGSANWEPYPLALWLLHDTVLFYQHDLSLKTMSDNKQVLTWNLAFGNMLSINWQWTASGPVDDPWLDLAAALQRAVAARYAGVPLDVYEILQPDVIRTVFGDLEVIANGQLEATYVTAGAGIAPGGFLAMSGDGSVVAGSFKDLFNGESLMAGEHFLIIERTPAAVIIRQPIGGATHLAVDPPTAGPEGATLWAQALDRHGRVLSSVTCSVVSGKVRLYYEPVVDGQRVDSYRICARGSLWLPLILRNQ